MVAAKQYDVPPYVIGSSAKFDIQLSAAKTHELRLAGILVGPKIELKTEAFQWEKTGNICIEFRCNGKPSGLSTTEAQTWFHELLNWRDGSTFYTLMIPVPRLKELGRRAFLEGRVRYGVGDGGKMDVILIPLKWFHRR